jgi:hypothetical protein
MALSHARDDDQAIRQAHQAGRRRISLAVADKYSYADRYHRPTSSSDCAVVHATLPDHVPRRSPPKVPLAGEARSKQAPAHR